MLPNCEEFIPVWFGILKAGAVMSSINTAYKGDFLSWTINLVEARKLVIADDVPGPAGPDQGRAAQARARDRAGLGPARGPGPRPCPRAARPS